MSSKQMDAGEGRGSTVLCVIVLRVEHAAVHL